MFLLSFLLFCIVILGLHLYFRYNHGARLIYKIKGPKEMFLFGNLFDIFLPPEQLFTKQIEWRKKYGNVWKLCGLNYRSVYFFKPEDIEVVLSSIRFLDKNMPYTFLFPWLREGLLTSTGEKWHHRRKMLTPAFHFLNLKKFFTTFYERAQDLMESMEKEVDKDKTDLFPLIGKSTLSVICETSMGATTTEDVNSLTKKYFKPLNTLVYTIVYRISRFWLFSEFAFQFTQVAKIQKAALKTLHDFTTQIIQDRREYRKNNSPIRYLNNDTENIDVYGNKTKLAMLDLLLDEEKKGTIDEEGIKEEVDTFMFEDSIFKEMQSIFCDTQRPPTIEDLNKMKYLECCIKESLRLYPSVHFISRYFKEDVTIGDHIIPYDTSCNINVFDIHRNPEIFPEPEKFIPERFLPENCVSRHPYAYIPFSAGPRNCIGQKFALMEMKTLVSSILRRFRLEPVTRPDEIVFTVHLVLRTTTPMYVRFRSRNNNI